MGQGQIHGKEGLPGVLKGVNSTAAEAKTSRRSLLTHQRSKKVLVPANLP